MNVALSNADKQKAQFDVSGFNPHVTVHLEHKNKQKPKKEKEKKKDIDNELNIHSIFLDEKTIARPADDISEIVQVSPTDTVAVLEGPDAGKIMPNVSDRKSLRSETLKDITNSSKQL